MKNKLLPRNWSWKRRVTPLSIILIGTLILFSIISYQLKPIVENDLFRYYAWAKDFAQHSYTSFIKNVTFDSKLVYSLFWLAGKADALGLIPMITVIIVYGITFGIIYDAGKTLQISQKIIFQYFLLAVALLQFSENVSNVRNEIAFAFLSLATYRDLFKKKRNILTILLYVLSCGCHLTALLLIVARLIIPFYKRFRFLFLLSIFCVPGLVNVLYWIRLYFSGNSYFIRIIEKAYYYFFVFKDTKWGQMVKYSGFEQMRKILFLFITCLFFIVTWHISKRNKRESLALFKFTLYSEIIVVLTLATMYIPVPIYVRFSLPMVILFSVPYFCLHKYSMKKYDMRFLLNIGYINLILAGIATQIYQFYSNFRI